MPPKFTLQSQVVLLRNMEKPTRLTSTGLSPSLAELSRTLRLHRGGSIHAHTPHLRRVSARIQFGLLPVRSPLLRKSLLFSHPPPTKMFQFGGFPLPKGTNALQRVRKSYSGISGSKTACVYPELIAACHALHRHSSLVIHHTA